MEIKSLLFHFQNYMYMYTTLYILIDTNLNNCKIECQFTTNKLVFKECIFLCLLLNVLCHVTSGSKVPPLCLVECASMWMGCEYDCRSEYQFIARTHPQVMDTCSNNCEQQPIMCMQRSLDPVCTTTAGDTKLYSAFRRQKTGNVHATVSSSPNGTQVR